MDSIETRRNLEWTGWWVVALGSIHVLFSLLFYREGWEAIWRGGLLNAVDGDLRREHAFWFTAFGPVMIFLGALMVWMERHTTGGVPKFLGWTFLGWTALTGFLMPASGIWLLVPPAIAIVRTSRVRSRR